MAVIAGWTPAERLRRIGALPLLEAVCAEHHVLPEQVLGRGRSRSVAAARHHLWLVLRDSLDFSYPEIAALFDVDHTTVLMGVRSYRGDIEARSFA